jgi:hypothetical protein
MVQMVLMFPQVYMAVLSDEEVQNCLCIKFPEKPRLCVVEAICLFFKMAVSNQHWNTLTKTLNTEVPGVYRILPIGLQATRTCGNGMYFLWCRWMSVKCAIILHAQSMKISRNLIGQP